MLGNLAKKVKNSRLAPLLLKLGIRKSTFAREIYGNLTAVRKERKAVIDGRIMYVDDHDSLDLLGISNYSNHETEIIKKYVKQGDVVLDLGANIGLYTLLISELAGKSGKVYSFEPDKTNFSILKKNIAANKKRNVVPVEAAVTDKDQKIKLYISEFNRGDHRIYPSDENRKFVEIEGVSLDNYFSEVGPKKVSFIKMDIQGSEPKAFEGMRKFLKKNKPVIMMEFWPAGIEGIGKSHTEFLKFLFENFQIYDSSDLHKPLTYEKVLKIVSPKKRNHINLLCLWKE